MINRNILINLVQNKLLSLILLCKQTFIGDSHNCI